MSRRLVMCLVLAASLGRLAAQGNEARELYLQGRDAFLTADYTRAIDLYRSSLRLNPDFGLPLAGLAECFFHLEEYEEALRHAVQARKYEQGNLQLAVLEGRIRIGLGELDQARSLFNQVLSREKNNLDAQFALAELDIAAGQNKSAALKYLETLKIRPDSQQAMLALAVLNDAEGNRPEALRYLELALRYHASDPRVRYAAARFALQQGEAQLAERHLQTALAVRPEYTAASLLLAQTYLQLGNPAAAVGVLRAVLERERTDPLAWYVLGLAYEKAGSNDEAQSAYTAAIRLNPEDELARVALENLALQKLPIKDEARRRYALPHLERGRRFEERNMLEKALNEYRRCLRLDPESREGRLAFAEVYRTLGFPAKYRQELEVLRQLGFKDNAIQDGIEIVASQLADTVSAQWGLSQYDLERRTYGFTVFCIPQQVREMHPLASSSVVEYFKDQLRRYDSVTIAPEEPLAGSFEDAFRRARSLGSDYFLILRFEESERSFAAELEQYLARTGTRVAVYRVFRTGNDRVQECAIQLTTALHAALPARGRIVARQFDQGVVDLGRLDGIKAEDKLVVVKRGKVRLSNDRVGLLADEADLLGEFRAERLDERVAAGTLSKRSFYDLINPGDEVIFQTPGAKAETPPAAPQGLLRRLYRFLGI